MDYEIVEGEVVDPGDDAPMDPWIAQDLADFQRHMEDMKQAYLFAAEGIRRGTVRTAPPPPAPAEPSLIHHMARACGQALVGAGTWLLVKFEAVDEADSEEPDQQEWGWAGQNEVSVPIQLPKPKLD